MAYIQSCIAFDRETFKIMWEMSEPGKDSEECFLRIPQTEYYAEKRYGANCLEVMPEVTIYCQFLTEDSDFLGQSTGSWLRMNSLLVLFLGFLSIR